MQNQQENTGIDAVQAALQSLLESPGFRSSKQCRLLLRYIVDHTLAGEEDLLRERVIGARIFGRLPGYDTASDPIVRARVAEVRKRLAQYYVDHRDSSGVSILIPSGSYRASFSLVAAPVEDGPRPKRTAPVEQTRELLPPQAAPTLVGNGFAVAEQRPLKPSPAGRRTSAAWFVFLCAILLIGCLAWFEQSRRQPQADTRLYQQFWAPLIQGSRPVLLYIGANYAYRLSPQYLESYREQHHLSNGGPEFPVDLKPNGTTANKDLRPTNTLIGFGDVAATGRLIATLTKLGQLYDLRYGDDITVTDLSSSAAVLIGGFSNPWSLKLTHNLRYTLEGGDRIIDHRDTSKVWRVQEGDPKEPQGDYVVISRLVHSPTGSFALVIAGVGAGGNQAAADFLGKPFEIGKVLQTAPVGWQHMNMQIVLRTTVLNGVPLTTSVMATHYW